MILDPIPYVVEESGDASDAPSGATPIALFGAGSGGDTSALEQLITDMQAEIDALTGRVEVLEGA